MKEKKETWEILKSLSIIIASVLVPIVVVIIGNRYSSAIKKSETQVRYVELSVDILKGTPTDKNVNMRKWAVDLINNYSEVKIDSQTRNELLNNPLYEAIDDFVANRYAPTLIKYIIEDPKFLEDFKRTINSGDKEAIKNMFTDFVVAAYNQLEKKKKELKEPIKTTEMKQNLPNGR